MVGRRLWRLVGVSLLVLAAVVAITTLWSAPMLAALGCPSCFGFELLSDRIYVDKAMTDPARAALAEAVSDGERRVALFYGDLTQAPTMFACGTQDCDRRIGDTGAQGVAYGTVALRLSPLGLDPVIVGRELCRIALHARIGLRRYFAGAIPAWFDEGLAVVVSEDSLRASAVTVNGQPGHRFDAPPRLVQPNDRRVTGCESW